MSDNGLSPIRRQAIISSNAWLLSIGPLETNFSEILIKIRTFSFTKMRLKMSYVKWRPLCPREDELMYHQHINLHPVVCGLNTLRPRQDGRYFADDVLKCIFLNENVRISLKIPLKFVPRGPINNIPALVQIMAWRRPVDKPLSEPMLIFVPTHICVTRPQWVNGGNAHESSNYGYKCMVW